MSRAETNSKTEELAANGITVDQPSDALMAGLREIGAQMLEDWKASAGASGAAILDAYNK